MPKSVSTRTQSDLLQQLEHIVDTVGTARNATTVLPRALQLLGEAVGARGGAVVFNREAPRRLQGYSWGEHQQQMLQLGQELADGAEANREATARPLVLPASRAAAALTGVLLAASLRGLQQAFGVIVLFVEATPSAALDTVLPLLYATGGYLGLYLQTVALQQRVQTLSEQGETGRGEEGTSYDPDRIIGESATIRAVMQQLQQAAWSRSTVLLRGESGTGKELGARALHRLSARSRKPFVKLNCAALPETLLESELFGHERGAFTGAVRMRRSRFEMADQGTLFLDEIGDLSLATQVKLLRVLQERTFERVGGNRPITVDVRIIAATNVDLEEAVRAGSFREDLYYRLNVVPIVLPPLRERREDIPLLVGHFLQRFNAENRKSLKISSAAMDLIVGYDWPGNVRELENCIERMTVMARSDVIAPEDVPVPINRVRPVMVTNTPSFSAPHASLPGVVADLERQRLIEALQRSGGVQTRAAAFLGITPRQLGYKLKKYQIDPRRIIWT
jgi:Nif-specific regulatory protein